jgi:plastocyanin
MNAVPANAATIQVTIDKLVFSPVEDKAKVGDTITSINKDIVAHTATARGDWDVMIEANKSARLVLKKAGIVALPSQHEGTDHHHAEVTRRPRKPAKAPSLHRTPCAAIRNE